ncbi:putative carboxylesterase [Helianthus debilis subsp. tardiflorus]
MDPSPDHIIKEIPGLIRVYKNGRYQKLGGTDTVPAGTDPTTGVQSKDVIISPDTPLSARLYIPKTANSNLRKLPLLIFYHGGAFIIDTAASPIYHNFLNLVASESNIVIVSVDYRTAPDHPVPTCFQDLWDAIKWVALHATGNGPEPWLNSYPDFGKVFFAGDSAGANIAHQMAIRVGSANPTRHVEIRIGSENPAHHMATRVGSENPVGGINLEGIILLHPYFWGKERVGSESDEQPWIASVNDIRRFVCPETSGLDDPLINPGKDPKVSDIGCSRLLVCVADCRERYIEG